MSRSKKLKILVPIILLLFLGAYAKHRLFDKTHIIGALNSKKMDEISGIAASSVNPNIYYVHNDSGDTSRFFAITQYGQLQTVIYFKADTTRRLGVRDCEDIAVGPGPEKNKSYIYLGDIGDNGSDRPFITVYRFTEKTSWATDSLTTAPTVPIHLKYPDGPRDAESMMVDPVEKLLCIVSKRGDTVALYTAPLKYKANDTLILTKRVKLFFPGFKPFKWVTAADISKDGQQILVKTYEKVYYWRRQGNEHIWDTMARKPRELNYEPERQGEAIGFSPDGTSYFTTSEGVFSPIYRYKAP